MKHAKALAHDDIEQHFDGIWTVQGEIRMPVAIPMSRDALCDHERDGQSDRPRDGQSDPPRDGQSDRSDGAADLRECAVERRS